MPSYVIKRAPDIDEYLYHSTVVDHPTSYVMTRAEMEEFLLSEHRSDSNPETLVKARLDRADRWGTSAMWPTHDAEAFGGWNDKVFLVTNCERAERGPDPWQELTRDELFEHMNADQAADEKERTAGVSGKETPYE